MAVRCEASRTDETRWDELLIRDVRDIFETKRVDRLTSEDLVNELVGIDGHPWQEMRGGRALTKAQLSRRLRKFGVNSGSIRTLSGTAKGYYHKAFADAFGRYIPPQNGTASQPMETGGFGQNQNVTPGIDVTFSNRGKPRDTASCDAVPFSKGGAGGERVCRICRGPIRSDEMSIPFADGSEAHLRCHEAA